MSAVRLATEPAFDADLLALLRRQAANATTLGLPMGVPQCPECRRPTMAHTTTEHVRCAAIYQGDAL